jgi:hypothetical protein
MSENYGSVIKKKLLGKFVEIYQGNTHRTLVGYADYDHDQKTVIYGKLTAVEGHCLTVEVARNDKVGNVYINTWSVLSITEPASGVGIDEAYWPASAIVHDRKKNG